MKITTTIEIENRENSNMASQIYAVPVKREMTDYVLITANSESDAVQKVNLLIEERDVRITSGYDGVSIETIGTAEVSKAEDASEQDDLTTNDEEWDDLESEDGASI